MMKRKLLVPMVALLLSVGMIGVGFATWMISNEDKHTENKGDFIVHDVVNNSITLTIDMSDDDINFGPATKTASGDWLSFDGTAAEDLSATLKLTVNEWKEDKGNLKTKTIKINVKDFAIVGADGFAGKNNSEYITLPADQEITIEPSGNTWAITVGNQPLTGAGIDGEKGEITIPLNFGWGSKVNGNPINHFNALENNEENRGKANDFLAEIYKLQGVKYQFTVTAKVG